MKAIEYEARHYAIAEAASEKTPVNGMIACSDCEGCGLVRSADALTPNRRAMGWKWFRWMHRPPVHYGVVLCSTCNGVGGTGTFRNPENVEVSS